MADHRRLAPGTGGTVAVESCWLCGIRLPADRMVADGGVGCTDLRWYCADMRGCTERWTAGTARPDLQPGAGGAPEMRRRPLARLLPRAA